MASETTLLSKLTLQTLLYQTLHSQLFLWRMLDSPTLQSPEPCGKILDSKSLMSHSMDLRSLAVTFVAHARYCPDNRTRYGAYTLPSCLANAAITNAAYKRRYHGYRLDLSTVPNTRAALPLAGLAWAAVWYAAQERRWSRSPNCLSPPSRSPCLHPLPSPLQLPELHIIYTNAAVVNWTRKRCFDEHTNTPHTRAALTNTGIPNTTVSRTTITHASVVFTGLAHPLQSPHVRTLHAVANAFIGDSIHCLVKPGYTSKAVIVYAVDAAVANIGLPLAFVRSTVIQTILSTRPPCRWPVCRGCCWRWL